MDQLSQIETISRAVFGRVEKEIGRKLDQFATGLRDFLYDLFNYPLERDWRHSLSLFYRHWAERGLVIKAESLAAIAPFIEARLAGSARQSTVTSPSKSPQTATEMKTSVNAAPDVGKAKAVDRAKERAEKVEAGRKALSQYVRQLVLFEKQRLDLNPTEELELETYISITILRQARGEQPDPLPQFWIDKDQRFRKRIAERNDLPGMGVITRAESDQSTLTWRRAHRDRLTPQELKELERIEEHEKWQRRLDEGIFWGFLNPANDGTGTLNDWAQIIPGLVSPGIPGTGGRPPRPPLALPGGRGDRNLPKPPTTPNTGAGSKDEPPKKSAKPPLPPPAAEVRVRNQKGRDYPHPSHVIAEAAERAAAQSIHDDPHEIVIFWGEKIGAHGADIISLTYNRQTKIVTLWDVKYRGEPRRIGPSETFTNAKRRAEALKKAEIAIDNSSLSPEDKKAALSSLQSGNFQTITYASGSAKNSTFGDHQR